MGFGVTWDTPAGSDRPLTMSTSSRGSFQSSLYLLAVSITLAAVYLGGCGGGWPSCTHSHSPLKPGQLAGTPRACPQAWWYSQAHGAAAERARLAFQRGAHQQVREEEEGAVLLPTHRLL